jgi:hypothetical protein
MYQYAFILLTISRQGFHLAATKPFHYVKSVDLFLCKILIIDRNTHVRTLSPITTTARFITVVAHIYR